jgi:hypothetical protein
VKSIRFQYGQTVSTWFEIVSVDQKWKIPLPSTCYCHIMLTRRRFNLALGTTVLATTAFAASSPADPITAIYRKAAAGKGEEGGTFVFLTRKDRARWLSKSLTKLWNDEDRKTPKGDQTPPGFDPVSNSQDPKVRNVKVELEQNYGKTATVAASFDSWPRGNTREEQERNPPEPKDRRTVRYDMVLENGRWKIDDIRGSTDGKEWSTRAIIKAWNAP